MSKIFDALQRGSGSDPDFIVSSICGGPGEEPAFEEFQPADGDDAVAVFETAGHEPAEPAAVAAMPAAAESARPSAGAGSAYRSVRLAPRCPVFWGANPHNLASEQYRMARTKISQHPSRPQAILVSSASPGDGKTTTAINLAAAMSLSSQRDVLLIDADLRRGCLAQQLGVAQSALGLCDVLTGASTLEDVVVRAEDLPSLCVLPAGEVKGNPAEWLDSPEWFALCDSLRRRFEWIVFDSPPMSIVADYDLLSVVADGVVLAATPDHTPRTLVYEAVRKIAPEKLIGVILNRVEKSFLFRYPQHDYYHYYSAKANGASSGRLDAPA